MKLIISLLMLFGSITIFADIKQGRKVYAANCSQCHSIHMTGGLGRDFNLVSYTRTKKQIRSYAEDPGSHFREFGYSSNAMPTLPLTPQELDDVTDFIDSLQPFKKWMVKKKS